MPANNVGNVRQKSVRKVVLLGVKFSIFSLGKVRRAGQADYSSAQKRSGKALQRL